MPKSESSFCEVKQKLAEQFAIAARLFDEAVVMLTHHPSHMAPGEHERLWTVSRQAMERAEAAARKYKGHVDAHGCAGLPTGGYQQGADSSR